MHAIKQVRKFLERDPESASARALARLVAALAEERDYPLADLYQMDTHAFELALDLLRDWRLDRYYAQRIKLFDFVLNVVAPPPAAN